MQRPIRLNKRGPWKRKPFGAPATNVFSFERSHATTGAGGIANPLLRAIGTDSDSFIRQRLSREVRIAVPIHPKPGETAMAQLASAKPGAEAEVKDAIDNLRSAAQHLYTSISDAAAKRSGATKAEIATLADKARALLNRQKLPSVISEVILSRIQRSLRSGKTEALAQRAPGFRSPVRTRCGQQNLKV
jgi:hypothetical protein